MSPLSRDLAWWVRDYAYALAWQTRAAFSRTDPRVFASGDGTPIVVLPGVYETWRFLQPLLTTLHDRGHPVHVIDLLRRNRRPVPEMAERVREYLVDHDLSGVVLVAHSKGGLIGKLVLASPEGHRIRGMVAVATPFGGSSYARLVPLAPTLRIFSPRDATILALARETTVNGRIVSIYGQFDPHIPQRSALDGAKNVELDTGGHFRILAHPRVIAEVVALAE
ncbi:esterase/lipase family protein [Microbacterium sp. RD1]|uniref:esterase/lipase family protein n=1 Tax=Microbacterium sp. RD1 TaxID=3457313 RepID=UPI003FA5873F